MDDNSVLLVIQENKRDSQLVPQSLPQGQLVAEAIAAFTQNNLRRKAVGRALVVAWNMPGIIMQGTCPTFYRINITQDLMNSVRMGQRPNVVTNLFRHMPMLPDLPELGMIAPLNRRVILQCYEAFRGFVIPSSPPPQ
jgi:hypothetical protein